MTAQTGRPASSLLLICLLALLSTCVAGPEGRVGTSGLHEELVAADQPTHTVEKPAISVFGVPHDVDSRTKRFPARNNGRPDDAGSYARFQHEGEPLQPGLNDIINGAAAFYNEHEKEELAAVAAVEEAGSLATFRPGAHRSRNSQFAGSQPQMVEMNARSWYPAASGSRADSVVTATPSQLGNRQRSIEDWSMDNLVLMATVDGSIYGRKRDTGEPAWQFSPDRPMVEIEYPSAEPGPSGRLFGSTPSLGGTTRKGPSSCNENDFMWIVEPSQDGALYIMVPGPSGGLQRLGITVRQLAEELSPYSSDQSPFIYTAEKKNTLYTLSATTGAPLRYFSASGPAYVPNENSCEKLTPLEALDDSEECGQSPTILLGRIEYTIAIHDRKTGKLACTIRYSEWTPNHRDRDLQAQYASPMDHRYIYSRFDGGIIALQFKDAQHVDAFGPVPGNPVNAGQRLYSQVRLLYNKKFSQSPVVQVFDVAKPLPGSYDQSSHVVLSQPVAPNSYYNPKRLDNADFNAIFINRTDEGSWYALSEGRFPSVTDGAAKAECYLPDGSFVVPSFDGLEGKQRCKHLVGVHYISSTRRSDQLSSRLAIDSPNPLVAGDNDIAGSSQPDDSSPVNFDVSVSYPDAAKAPIISTSVVLSLMILSLAIFVSAYKTGGKSMQPVNSLFTPVSMTDPHTPTDPGTIIPAVGEHGGTPIYTDQVSVPGQEIEELEHASKSVRFAELSLASGALSIESDEQPADVGKGDSSLSDPSSEPIGVSENGNELSLEVENIKSEDGLNTEPEKKKARRGQRGGRRRKKKSLPLDPTSASAVNKIDGVEMSSTISGESAAENDDVHEINNLVINKSVVLGHGSGGTVVFGGKFEGRSVAVKRLLLESFQLAFQEVDLLQQSDDHPNVIRYFCHQKDSNFLYIALELCQTSIWDIFHDGISTGAMSEDKEEVGRLLQNEDVAGLHQLASGLNHLHSLRIIHRDIKPQNILVAYPKKNKPSSSIRLVISDFGLCKSLPDNVSTLVGTTGYAGTIGWKAPELILQPRIEEGKSSASASGSGGSPDSSGLEGPTSGVKRSVDIFSLGCVFFYVLTRGAHPFDNDDNESWHSLREVNIKKNKTNLERLRQMGTDSDEPLHLIEWMLNPAPEQRPTALQVMNHPLFWSPAKRLGFLCDVSDHWERESRDPPSPDLVRLESFAPAVLAGTEPPAAPSPDGLAQQQQQQQQQPAPAAMANPRTARFNFFARLSQPFVETLGKQRKYSADKLMDMLRALRNKKNHYAEMPPEVRAKVGPLPDGYLAYWTSRYPALLMSCWKAVLECGLDQRAPFKAYMHGEGA